MSGCNVKGLLNIAANPWMPANMDHHDFLREYAALIFLFVLSFLSSNDVRRSRRPIRTPISFTQGQGQRDIPAAKNKREKCKVKSGRDAVLVMQNARAMAQKTGWDQAVEES
jgi:hypothetical protein